MIIDNCCIDSNCAPMGASTRTTDASAGAVLTLCLVAPIRYHMTIRQVAFAARAKAERSRPPEIEERVRIGVPGAAIASDVFAPKPGDPCPLLGRWLKVAFADV